MAADDARAFGVHKMVKRSEAMQALVRVDVAMCERPGLGLALLAATLELGSEASDDATWEKGHALWRLCLVCPALCYVVPGTLASLVHHYP